MLTLAPLPDAELPAFHANLVQFGLWPEEKFPKRPTLDDVKSAIAEKFWSLFALRTPRGPELYAAVVHVGLPYFALHPIGPREVEVEAGRAAVVEVLRWAFGPGRHERLYFYLPASYVHVADELLDLGFEPVRDAAAQEAGERLMVMDREVFRDLGH